MDESGDWSSTERLGELQSELFEICDSPLHDTRGKLEDFRYFKTAVESMIKTLEDKLKSGNDY